MRAHPSIGLDGQGPRKPGMVFVKLRVPVAGSIAVVASLALAASASAAGKTAVVTTNTDSGSNTGCELRDAIQAVTTDTNVNGCVITSPGGDDHVNFAP